MNIFMMALACALASALPVPGPRGDESAHPAPAALHTHTEFHFTVQAPMATAAALFGANEERKWALGWNPQFLQPVPARDTLGAVFQISRPGGSAATWIMTAADFAGGHIQYVYVIPDAMATLIDIRLTAADKGSTSVQVVYERTALCPAANEQVENFAAGDAGQAPEWQAAINGYLRKQSELN